MSQPSRRISLTLADLQAISDWTDRLCELSCPQVKLAKDACAECPYRQPVFQKIELALDKLEAGDPT